MFMQTLFEAFLIVVSDKINDTLLRVTFSIKVLVKLSFLPFYIGAQYRVIVSLGLFVAFISLLQALGGNLSYSPSRETSI